MTGDKKADWPIPAALLALGVVPVTAGAFRLVQLFAGVEITPDNLRFFAAPWPVALHIVSATIFSVFGAWQFAPRRGRTQSRWHRMAGRWLVPFGLAAALSGLWMTQFYPPGLDAPASFDGAAVHAIRLLAGSTMVVSLCLGLAAILKRDLPSHQAWMMRGYALGLGAGTQVLTHLPWFLFPSIHGETARALMMGAGWVINLAVAEWLIVRGRSRSPIANSQ
jgi:hypothetical protein